MPEKSDWNMVQYIMQSEVAELTEEIKWDLVEVLRTERIGTVTLLGWNGRDAVAVREHTGYFYPGYSDVT